MGAEQLGAALDGADVVVIPAGVPRKPGLFVSTFCFMKYKIYVYSKMILQQNRQTHESVKLFRHDTR
jgi:hypothetical protein